MIATHLIERATRNLAWAAKKLVHSARNGTDAGSGATLKLKSQDSALPTLEHTSKMLSRPCTRGAHLGE
jgi:hypothetical protein